MWSLSLLFFWKIYSKFFISLACSNTCPFQVHCSFLFFPLHFLNSTTFDLIQVFVEPFYHFLRICWFLAKNAMSSAYASDFSCILFLFLPVGFFIFSFRSDKSTLRIVILSISVQPATKKKNKFNSIKLERALQDISLLALFLFRTFLRFLELFYFLLPDIFPCSSLQFSYPLSYSSLFSTTVSYLLDRMLVVSQRRRCTTSPFTFDLPCYRMF